jgi:hypothetical protein
MVQVLSAIFLIVAGVIAGRCAGRGSLWWLTVVAPLLVVALVILGHRSMTLSVLPPISWAIHPDVGPYLMALAIPALLSTLGTKLPDRRKRAAVTVLMLFMVAAYSFLPIVSPLTARASLLAGHTVLDSHGICHQTHPYTCGPASAVTCLAFLGVSSDESTIAIAARCGPAIGTDPILLRDTLNQLYKSRGVHCDYRIGRNLDDMKTPFIATMWIPPIGGHYVAVLDVSSTAVIVGDPLSGRCKWSRTEFEQDWKGAAHELSRVPSP